MVKFEDGYDDGIWNISKKNAKLIKSNSSKKILVKAKNNPFNLIEGNIYVCEKDSNNFYNIYNPINKEYIHIDGIDRLKTCFDIVDNNFKDFKSYELSKGELKECLEATERLQAEIDLYITKSFELERKNNMKKTFKEVINDGKINEIWENENTQIFIGNKGKKEEFDNELPNLFKEFKMIKYNNGLAFTDKIESVEVITE